MRPFIGALCALLFIVSLPAALILVNAENQLFKSSTYKTALQTTGLYARLPALVSQQISSGLATTPGQPGEAGYLKLLSAKDLENLINVVIPPEQMQALAGQTLDQAFDYLDGKTDSVSISLVAFKADFGQNSTQAIRRILAGQPDCTPQALIGIAMQIASGQQSLGAALCNPPAQVLSALMPILSQGLQAEISTLPDSLPLFKTADQPGLRPAVQRARLIMRWSLLVPLALLLLMTVLAVRSLRGWLRWWGLPLLAGGAIGLLAGLLYAPVTGLILAAALPGMPPWLAGLVAALPDVPLAVARQVADPLVSQSLAALVVGLALSLLALITRSRKSER